MKVRGVGDNAVVLNHDKDKETALTDWTYNNVRGHRMEFAQEAAAPKNRRQYESLEDRLLLRGLLQHVRDRLILTAALVPSCWTTVWIDIELETLEQLKIMSSVFRRPASRPIYLKGSCGTTYISKWLVRQLRLRYSYAAIRMGKATKSLRR